MALDRDRALERVLASGDEWQSWRALKLSGDDPGDLPGIPGQDELGGFAGPSGRLSPGTTGLALCHLAVLGLESSAPAVVALDWLEEARTPAMAWLDAPGDVPGDLDDPSGSRVWATASATCALLALGRDPGPRALALLRGESAVDGRFTGGAYATAAAAGAYWQGEGPKTEIAEWALRWERESTDEFDPELLVDALTFWAAARIPAEHSTVEAFVETLNSVAGTEGFDDLATTIGGLELLDRFGA